MSPSLPRVSAAERRAISFGGPVRMASWWAILARTRRRMGKDNLSALAAGAAFQSLLSLFPTLTAVVSVYGLVADPNMVERQITAMQGVLPPEAVKLIATWLQALVQGPTTKFGVGLIVSVLLAFWSMWSATGMLMTAVNICYGEEEKRDFISFNLHALALGGGLALFGVAALALVAVLPAAFAFLPVSDALGRRARARPLAGSGRDRHPCACHCLPLRARSGEAEVAMDQLGVGRGNSAMGLGLDRLHDLRLEGR
jgi:membrane protein